MSISKSLIAASIIALGATAAGCTKEDKVVQTAPPNTTTASSTPSPAASSSTDPSVPPSSSVTFPPSNPPAAGAAASSAGGTANVSADLSQARQELSSLTERLNDIERKQSGSSASSIVGGNSGPGSSNSSVTSGGSTSNPAVTGSASDDISALRRDLASLRERLNQMEQTQRGASLSIPPTASR